ncbi:MAG: hypothetical protein IPP90_13860 [Gemmatimonadaceae bacterium]|nr:hypothetical protein [Gemmatimonadaceae bacterium]
MSVTQDEVSVGLVARLDTTVLRTLGGCQTNAVLGPEGDRAVVGPHDFLIVGVDAASGVCTAVPLFPKTAVGNQPLVNGKKSGGDDGWVGVDTFFSHWQHWRMPVTSVVVASEADSATALTRRRYGAQDRTALDEIRAWEKRNRAPYRAV